MFPPNPEGTGRWQTGELALSTSAARLTQRVPWLCAPPSREVCLFRMRLHQITTNTDNAYRLTDGGRPRRCDPPLDPNQFILTLTLTTMFCFERMSISSRQSRAPPKWSRSSDRAVPRLPAIDGTPTPWVEPKIVCLFTAVAPLLLKWRVSSTPGGQ
jgi:hypothetical protein